MGLQLNSAIAIARGILNDPIATRYSDVDLLQYANDALDVMTKLTPQLFYTDGDVACIAGSAMQTVSYDDALALVDVRRIKNGNAVLPGDRATLDAFSPGWQAATGAAAVNWMPVADDPVRFLIYPPAPTNQTLEVVYVRIPPEYSGTADTGIPISYADAVADYIVHRAESRDAEHVISQRAQAFGQSFVSKITGK